MVRLGVNIDHVATLRELRGTPYPSIVEAARICMAAGAHGITVHLREDRRHIRDDDVRALRATSGLPLNLEMANAPDVVAVALEVRPDEACLVPERREERTTEGGLDAVGEAPRLAPLIARLSAAGIRVSLFIEPDPAQVAAAARLGVPCIELHTGAFCRQAGAAAAEELARLKKAAVAAQAAGLQVNAGHGIALHHIPQILEIPGLHTLNIGHSLVCEAVFVGLGEAVRRMAAALQAGGGRHP